MMVLKWISIKPVSLIIVSGLMIMAACTNSSSGDKPSERVVENALTPSVDIREESPGLSADAGMAEREKRNAKLNAWQEMNDMVEVTLKRKAFFEGSHQKHFVCRIKIENKSGKDIRSVVGILQLKLPGNKDLPDNQIKLVLVNYEKGIAANSTVGERIKVEYNELDGQDQLLKTLEVEDLTTEWVTERIIFVDGSMMPVAN